jgi:hypothetical protein
VRFGRFLSCRHVLYISRGSKTAAGVGGDGRLVISPSLVHFHSLNVSMSLIRMVHALCITANKPAPMTKRWDCTDFTFSRFPRLAQVSGSGQERYKSNDMTTTPSPDRYFTFHDLTEGARGAIEKPSERNHHNPASKSSLVFIAHHECVALRNVEGSRFVLYMYYCSMRGEHPPSRHLSSPHSSQRRPPPLTGICDFTGINFRVNVWPLTGRLWWAS